MRRDLDLARQLLFEIEQQGADCSLATLRGTLIPTERVISDRAINGRVAETRQVEADEAILYQLRLMIDGGLAKEIDRTGASPCIRLTHAGHELLELSRSEARWQEAKLQTLEASGGESLTVIRALLTKWAVESAARPARVDTRPMARPYTYRHDYPQPAPRRSYAVQHVAGDYRPYHYGPYNYGDYANDSRYVSPDSTYGYGTDSVLRSGPTTRPISRTIIGEEGPAVRPVVDRAVHPVVREPSMNVLRPRPDYREPLPVRARYDIRQQLDWRDAYDRDFYYGRSPYSRYEAPQYAATQYGATPSYGHDYRRTAEVYPSEVDSAPIGVSLPIYMV